MTSLDLSGSIPYFIFFWVGGLVLAVLRSASLTGTRAKALRSATWWITNASWLSVGFVAHAAYFQRLISLPLLIVTVVVAYLLTAGIYWLVDRRYA
jgi:hypothetical protein